MERAPNRKTQIMKWAGILAVTHVAAFAVGALGYRWLTAESEQFKADVKAQAERVRKLDQTLAKSVDRPAPSEPVAAAGTANEATASPERAKDEKATGERPMGATLSGTEAFGVQSKGMSRVTFTSDAPLETIVGTTTAAMGDIKVDLGDPSNTTAEVRVDLSTLRTGIDLRDEHLRGENWLDTGKHPYAAFKLQRFEYDGPSMTEGGEITATAHGTINIRGVEKTIAVPVKMSYYKWTPELKEVYVDGNVIRVSGNFEVKLSEFGIDAGGLFGKKVAETVRVDLNLTGVAQ